MGSGLISVIIPVYNVEHYIRLCLDSVINQTYKNLEILIIDDWSTDDSWKICDEYAGKDIRIKVMHQGNEGVSSARNLWLKMATWEYIWYVDSDDFIQLDMYEKLYEAMKKFDAELSVCNQFIWQKNWKWIENKRFPKKHIITRNDALKQFYWIMYVWNKLYRRNVVKDILFEWAFGEDAWYNFKIITKINTIVCVSEFEYFYRYNKESVSHTGKLKEEYLQCIDFLDVEIEYCKKNKMVDLGKKIIGSKVGIVSARLYYISFEKNPDMRIVNSLQKIVKENIFYYLCSDANVIKKIFAIIVSINFFVAKSVSRFIRIIYP